MTPSGSKYEINLRNFLSHYTCWEQEGSLAAINAALAEDPEGFHVLHLSCHACPGELVLETPDGEADWVTAERLLAEGIPAGADLPMIVLSGCSTGLTARQERLPADIPADRAGGQFKDERDREAVLTSTARRERLPADIPAERTGRQFKDEREGEAVLASFAAELVRAGVPQVLATQAPVTDRYAASLAAGLYRRLATDAG